MNPVEASGDAGADRFVLPSSAGAGAPEEGPDPLRASDLAHSIVRPGEVTTEAGAGRVRTGTALDGADGDVPRAVAEVLVATLDAEATAG